MFILFSLHFLWWPHCRTIPEWWTLCDAAVTMCGNISVYTRAHFWERERLSRSGSRKSIDTPYWMWSSLRSVLLGYVPRTLGFREQELRPSASPVQVAFDDSSVQNNKTRWNLFKNSISSHPFNVLYKILRFMRLGRPSHVANNIGFAGL